MCGIARRPGAQQPLPQDEDARSRVEEGRLTGASQAADGFPSPSRPGEFHPEALTEPDVSLSTYPARATQ